MENTMKIKIKLLLQYTLSFILLFTVIGVLAYHEISVLQEKSIQNYKINPKLLMYEEKWQERLPRSLNLNNYIKKNSILKDSLINYEYYDNLNTVATIKPPVTLHDIFISVKTTKKFHHSRVDLIVKTWFNQASKQTWFFTDSIDEDYQRKTGGHMINTNCSSSHNRNALCCKMSKEFDAFLDSSKRWWCHFDDDNYVNIRSLVGTLDAFDPTQDWYLGRPSIKAPLEILNRDDLSKISFWFATGGAGFCVSRSLALKMMPIAGGGRFISVGEKIRLPDDVTMGYIIEHVLGKKLTIVDEFHSHLEPMKFLDPDTLHNQISLGYSSHDGEINAVSVPGLPERIDPTRMISLHCKLYPNEPFCPR